MLVNLFTHQALLPKASTLFFFPVLKAFQNDKPPVLPPTGEMMLLSWQPKDNPPPPDTLPLFGPVMSFEAWRQTGATGGRIHTVNTHTYTLIRISETSVFLGGCGQWWSRGGGLIRGSRDHE